MVAERDGLAGLAFASTQDDAMSSVYSTGTRSIQSSLTRFGIEQSPSVYMHHGKQQLEQQKEQQPRPTSPLDKARMQWRNHKHSIEADAEADAEAEDRQADDFVPAPSTQLDDDDRIFQPQPSRSRSKSPERMPMYGDRARGDYRSYGRVGEPIEAVKLRPVPKSQLVRRSSRSRSSRSRSRCSHSSRASRHSRSNSRRVDVRDDAGSGGRSSPDNRDGGFGNLVEDFAVRASKSFEDMTTKSFEAAEEAKRKAMDALGSVQPDSSDCSNIIGNFAVQASKSFEKLSRSIEEADAMKRKSIEDLSADVRKSMPSPPEASSNAKETAGPETKMAMATSFASVETNRHKINDQSTSSVSVGSIFSAGMSVLQGLCCFIINESSSADANTITASSRTAQQGKCLTGIPRKDTFSLDGDDEEGEGGNFHSDQLLMLRETFSNLSSSLPEVGWKINVSSKNRRVVQRRDGAIGHGLQPAGGSYKVAIIDDRADAPGGAFFKIASVKRDPSLLSRCHYAGWDGKRSHFTVLTPPIQTQTDASSGVLQKLKEMPGTQAITNFLSLTDSGFEGPKWMHPDIAPKFEGTDAVIHLVVGPEHSSSKYTEDKKELTSKASNGDEEKMLNKILSELASLSEDYDGDENDDDNESYQPSTVGPIEDQLLRDFLGSDEEETAYTIGTIDESITRNAVAEHPPEGRPPLCPRPPTVPPISRPRTNTTSSRTSTGSFHRRNNSIDTFTGALPLEFADPRSNTHYMQSEVECKGEEKSKKTKGKFGLRRWRKRSTAEIPSATTYDSFGSKRVPMPVQRSNSIILKSSTSVEPEIVHSPQEFLIECPMFRRALRSMGYCGKSERPRIEGWVAFSKGDILQTVGPHRNLRRNNFRYIVLTTKRGKPTIHIMTSKMDAKGASVDDVEHLVLTKNMKVTCSDASNGNGRCLCILDSRIDKVIGTIMPVLINKDLFVPDGSKSCLIEEKRFEKIISRSGSSDAQNMESPSYLDGQLDASNHVRFVLDCEMTKPAGSQKEKEHKSYFLSI